MLDPELNTLQPGELDIFVECMVTPRIDIIGNDSWMDWHIRLQKLYQQAIAEATTKSEELTKDALISCGKLPLLVYEAICIEVWRLKIYPQLFKLEPAPINIFGIYMALYHEATAVSLLETVLFYEEGVECISEVLIDLLQYAVEQMTKLLPLLNNGIKKQVTAKEMDSETSVEELERMKRVIQFDISMRCITIVRYLTEATGLDASIATTLYKTYDIPSLLCHLIELEPWKRRNNKGELEIFHLGTWDKPEAEEMTKLHRAEVQLWLCLRQLLLDPRLDSYYTIDECRRNTFCKNSGASRISETMLDQIPPLGDLKTFLCRLSVGDYSSLHNTSKGDKNPGCILIEILPQIKNSYVKQVHKRTKTIAKTQLQYFRVDDTTESRSRARRLVESYTSETMMNLGSGKAKCAKCGDAASKKCSRCKSEWYCGRECQVQQWPKHKDICDQFTNVSI